MIGLSVECLRRRLGQTYILLERLVILFNFPSFLIDCRDVLIRQTRVTSHQIENPCTAIF
jgi:hypothetical protein